MLLTLLTEITGLGRNLASECEENCLRCVLLDARSVSKGRKQVTTMELQSIPRMCQRCEVRHYLLDLNQERILPIRYIIMVKDGALR